MEVKTRTTSVSTERPNSLTSLSDVNPKRPATKYEKEKEEVDIVRAEEEEEEEEEVNDEEDVEEEEEEEVEQAKGFRLYIKANEKEMYEGIHRSLLKRFLSTPTSNLILVKDERKRIDAEKPIEVTLRISGEMKPSLLTSIVSKWKNIYELAYLQHQDSGMLIRDYLKYCWTQRPSAQSSKPAAPVASTTPSTAASSSSAASASPVKINDKPTTKDK